MGLLILAVTALLAGVVVWAQFNHPGPVTAPIPPAASKSTAGAGAVKAIPKRKSFRETLESAKDTPGQKRKKTTAYMIPSLIEDSDHGPLPKRASDGRMPRTAYAASFDTKDKRPRIAIILTGLGMRKTVDDLALRSLPATITFAYSPYGSDLLERSRKAREAGHEILMTLPIEARNTKMTDRGAAAIRIADDSANRMISLFRVMSRFGGYVGLLATRNEALSFSEGGTTEILSEIDRRGLIYLAPKSEETKDAGKMGAAGTDTNKDGADITTRRTGAAIHLWLDRTLTPQGIQRAMEKAETTAKRGGKHLIVAARAYPMTINAIRRWAAGLPDKGLIAAPLTAVLPPAHQTANK